MTDSGNVTLQQSETVVARRERDTLRVSGNEEISKSETKAPGARATRNHRATG